MALDIGIGDGTSPMPSANEPVVQLDNEGFYWFLHPLLEKLQIETGQYVDLYGDASFADKDLEALDRMLDDARTIVDSQPLVWKVHIGNQIRPERKELFADVEKVRFMKLLGDWKSIVERARQLCRPVVCFGD